MVGLYPRAAAVVGMVVLAVGCDVDFFSESGHIGFDAPELHRSSPEEFRSGDPIAVGSRVCPQFDGYCKGDSYREASDDASLRSCFELSASGPVTFDGQCLQIDGPGEVIWSLESRGKPCIDETTFESDQVRFTGVAVEDLVTEEAAWVERLAATGDWIVANGMAPPDIVPAPGATLAIVEGVTVTARLGLWDPQKDTAVAWTDSEVVVVPENAAVPTYGDEEDERVDDTVLLRLVDGATAEVSLRVAGEPAAPLAVESVPADSLHDLQLVAFFSLDPSEEVPAIVRAIARDEEGRLVRGVPVTWSTEGDPLVMPLWGDATDPDYVLVDVGCREPGEPAQVVEGTIMATLGEQTAVLDVGGAIPPCAEPEGDDDEGDDGKPSGADDDPDGRDDDGGLASCACTTGPAGPSPLALVVVGGLVAWLRRRQPARV